MDLQCSCSSERVISVDRTTLDKLGGISTRPHQQASHKISIKLPTATSRALMVYETNDRVSDALTSLVELFLPLAPNEDEEGANDRRNDVHDTLESIIEENAFRLTGF